MEKIKELFEKIKNGLRWFFGNSPDLQVVSDNNEETVIDSDNMSPEELAQLEKALAEVRIRGDELKRRIESSIQILPGDLGNPIERVETPKVAEGELVNHVTRSGGGRSLDD